MVPVVVAESGQKSDCPIDGQVKAPALTFEERYTEICGWIDKRKASWDLNKLEWLDARQIILSHVNEKLYQFDPARGEFSHWLNALITSQIKNLWRKYYTKYSRPCILGCVYNGGGTSCTQTKSGEQCAECPLYADWWARKGDHYRIEQPLPLENHSQEVHNTHSTFIDIEGKKKVIDQKMKERLNRADWKMYRLLYIKGMKEEDVAKAMGYRKKRGSKSKMHAGYQIILAAKGRFKDMVREVIEQENLA